MTEVRFANAFGMACERLHPTIDATHEYYKKRTYKGLEARWCVALLSEMCLCIDCMSTADTALRTASTSQTDAGLRKCGNVQLIVGPMFSGKTSEMIRRIVRYRYAKKKCVIIKYADDVRYDVDRVCTHDMVAHEALKCMELRHIAARVHADAYDVVGVDEAQFYEGDDLHEFCTSNALAGRIVVVAGLDATYDLKPFSSVCNLIPVCEQVTKLTAVCSDCGRDACFSQRLVKDTHVKLIGGSDVYKPVCRFCYVATAD